MAHALLPDFWPRWWLEYHPEDITAMVREVSIIAGPLIAVYFWYSYTMLNLSGPSLTESIASISSYLSATVDHVYNRTRRSSARLSLLFSNGTTSPDVKSPSPGISSNRLRTTGDWDNVPIRASPTSKSLPSVTNPLHSDPLTNKPRTSSDLDHPFTRAWHTSTVSVCGSFTPMIPTVTVTEACGTGSPESAGVFIEGHCTSSEHFTLILLTAIICLGASIGLGLMLCYSLVFYKASRGDVQLGGNAAEIIMKQDKHALSQPEDHVSRERLQEESGEPPRGYARYTERYHEETGHTLFKKVQDTETQGMITEHRLDDPTKLRAKFEEEIIDSDPQPTQTKQSNASRLQADDLIASQALTSLQERGYKPAEADGVLRPARTSSGDSTKVPTTKQMSVTSARSNDQDSGRRSGLSQTGGPSLSRRYNVKGSNSGVFSAVSRATEYSKRQQASAKAARLSADTRKGPKAMKLSSPGSMSIAHESNNHAGS